METSSSVKALILFDSFFGNTEQIGLAIAKAFDNETTVAKRINEAIPADLEGITHLVIGSPTRGFRPSEGTTAFLKTLPANLKSVKVATFDTRIDLETIKGKLWRYVVDKGGYAATTIAKQLTQRKALLVVPAEGFFVTGEQGPLKEGETERALEWGKKIASL